VHRLRPAESNPFDSFDDLQMLLFRQYGVISRRQALRWLTTGAVRHRLATGSWQQVHWGIYVVGGTPALDSRQRAMVASLAAGSGRPGAVGGVSALQVLGLRGFSNSAVHVVIPARYRVHEPPPFVVVHRTRSLGRDQIQRTTAPPCTVAGRSVVDAAQWAASDAIAAALVAAAFQQRLVSLAEVLDAAERQPAARRRPLTLDVAHEAGGGAHSLPEVEFVRLCRRAGLPAPECQVRRVDRAGRRRYLDAYFKDFGVHVEIDGEQHADASSRWADMKRQNDLWVAGDRVLRFPAWVVRRHPAQVVDQVREALTAAGWRPELIVDDCGRDSDQNRPRSN
jgi:very-short-patch-repair endonuclease